MAPRNRPHALTLAEPVRVFEALKPRLRNVPLPISGRLNLDLRNAALAGRSLHRRVTCEPLKSRLEIMSPAMFDLEQVELLDRLTIVLWYLKMQMFMTQARSNRRRLPEALFEEATLLRTRLITLLGYHLRANPETMGVIDMVRRNKGHVNLASDLEILAVLVTDHAALLVDDVHNHHPDDASRALELTDQIRAALVARAPKRPGPWAARAFILFSSVYEDVREAATFAGRKLTGVSEIPSLTRAARKPRRASRSQDRKTAKKDTTEPSSPTVVANTRAA